jgi:hypothetical protein
MIWTRSANSHTGWRLSSCRIKAGQMTASDHAQQRPQRFPLRERGRPQMDSCRSFRRLAKAKASSNDAARLCCLIICQPGGRQKIGSPCWEEALSTERVERRRLAAILAVRRAPAEGRRHPVGCAHRRSDPVAPIPLGALRRGVRDARHTLLAGAMSLRQPVSERDDFDGLVGYAGLAPGVARFWRRPALVGRSFRGQDRTMPRITARSAGRSGARRSADPVHITSGCACEVLGRH